MNSLLMIESARDNTSLFGNTALFLFTMNTTNFGKQIRNTREI